jgi:hypothetical protein
MGQKKIFFSVTILALALMAAFLAVGLPAGESSTDTLDLSATESSILEAYGKLPLLFIENQGQVDETVRYYVKASGQTVYFTEENIVFDLVRSGGVEADGTADRLVFSIDFLGANSQAAIEGCDKDSAVVNYFIGNDPAKWYANVPTYRELVYRDIYPNIDLRLYGNGGMLRYDFAVNPGATPEAIALAYTGIDSLAVVDGDLIIGTALGDIVQSQPYIYQQIGDEVVEGEGGFRLGSDNTYGFHVPAYNDHYPLIIDPMLLHYSTYLGGEGNDRGYGIAVDSNFNAYVIGSTESTNFPTQSALQVDEVGIDAFVTKLSRNGDSLVYSTYLGGDGYEVGRDIAVDSEGNAYVTGYTWPSAGWPPGIPGFPTTPGAFEIYWQGGYDAFVTKLSRNGSSLVYSTYLGGEGDDYGLGIALDEYGFAYITGTTDSSYPGFPTTHRGFQTENAGGYDAFVTKLSWDGSSLLYSTYLGGGFVDQGWNIAVDLYLYAYVTGWTCSAYPDEFPTTPGAFQIDNAAAGCYDAFVTKLSPRLDALVYSTYLGGEGDDYGYGIAIDSAGNAYVTGSTTSEFIPWGPLGFPITPDAFQIANAGYSDAFVTKLAWNGSSLVYSTYLGGEAEDYARGIAVDSAGNAYVTGYTDSNDFPTQNAYQSTLASSRDAFVTKLAWNGSSLVYSTYLGGILTDSAWDIAVDSNAYAYVTGYTRSVSPFGFPTTPYAFQQANAGIADAFVTKIMELQGCCIANAAYDTPMAEEIQILREFRDEYLLTSWLGQAMVDVYYRVSRPMAEFITEHPGLKPIVRAGLVPAVAVSTVAVNTTPAEKAAIVGLVVLVSVVLAVWAKRRRGRGPEYA